jgi:hypothetical protein
MIISPQISIQGFCICDARCALCRLSSFPDPFFGGNSLSGRHGSLKEVWKDEWQSFVRFAVPFLFDTAKGALILLALYFFGWILHLATSYGLIRDDYATAFEKVHFWLNFGAYSILGLDFLWRLSRTAFQGERK